MSSWISDRRTSTTQYADPSSGTQRWPYVCNINLQNLYVYKNFILFSSLYIYLFFLAHEQMKSLSAVVNAGTPRQRVCCGRCGYRKYEKSLKLIPKLPVKMPKTKCQTIREEKVIEI